MSSRPTLAIWGPPGSGKTRSLLDILTNSGFDLNDVVFSTFRKALAEEVKERLRRRFGVGKLPKSNFIGTTHSICYKLLIEEGLEREVATTADKKDFCNGFGVDFSWGQSESWDIIDVPEGALGNLLFSIRGFCVKNLMDFDEGWPLAPIPGELRRRVSARLVLDFVDEWEDYKDENGLLDFEDMLKEVYEDKLVPPADALFEDEFHDKTPLQYEIYKKWARETPEVYVAGDVLQSIYEFWGTDPSFFERDLERAKERRTLPKSYRFGSKLWKYARQIPKRAGLKIPELEALGATEVHSLNMYGFEKVVPQVQNYNVLYLLRARYMFQPISQILRRAGIPFVIDFGSTSRVVELFNAVVEARRQTAGDSVPSYGKIENITEPQALALINSYPAECFEKTKKSLREEVKDKFKVSLVVTPLFKDLIRGENPFSNLLKSAPVRKDERRQLFSMWDNRGLNPVDTDNQHVLTTVHGSKGREADHVFLFDDITRRVAREGDPENESRVFFVGATRAKKHLWVVHGPNLFFTYSLPRVQS